MPELATGNHAPVSVEEYRAFQRPFVPRTPQQLFDWMVEERLPKKFDGMNVFSSVHADPFCRKIPASNQLFLLVPPQPKGLLEDRVLLDHLVSLIGFDGKNGQNYLDPKELTDLIEVPAGPSLLTNIDDGRLRLNVKPSISRERIKKEGRHPYTTWRGIVHGIVFPDISRDLNMDLVGSRYGSGSTPILYLSGGRLKLNARWFDVAFPRWGAPSCGRVLIGA